MRSAIISVAIGALLGGVILGISLIVSSAIPHTSATPVAAILTDTPMPQSVSLLFVGDIMLSRSVGALMLEQDDWFWPFRQIASVTAEADLAFANLETTVSNRGTASGCGFCFRADPRSLQGLAVAGFDVVSVANNHIWDYGADAFVDTLMHVRAMHIDPVGGGSNLAEARAPVIREVRGTRIAYLAYTDLLPLSAGATLHTPGVNRYDPVRMQEDIAAARQLADVVIVSFHTGDEYHLAHNAKQERIYHAAIDAGADLVVGHHPHVVQEVEHYRGGWIAYSLGNFIFDQNFSVATTHGLMLRVTLVDGHISDVASSSVTISPQYQPSLQQ